MCRSYFDHSLISVYEENRPRITRNLLKKELNNYWENEKREGFQKPIKHLIKKFTEIDEKLKKISRKTGIDCTVSTMTLLIYKDRAVVFAAGNSKMIFLTKDDFFNYSQGYSQKPLGMLDAYSDIVKGHFAMKEDRRILLYTKGMCRSIRPREILALFGVKPKYAGDLIYAKAIREGRRNCSIACLDYEAA